MILGDEKKERYFGNSPKEELPMCPKKEGGLKMILECISQVSLNCIGSKCSVSNICTVSIC